MKKSKAKPTKKPKVHVTRATDADVKEMVGDRAKVMPSMVAWCGRVNGKMIGSGGYFKHQGRWHGFIDLTPECDNYRKELHYWAIRALQHAQKTGIRFIYAEMEPEGNPGASNFLYRLGFRLDPRSLYYFRWRAK